MMRATKKLMSLCEVVEEKLIMRGTRIREEKRKAREKKEQQEQHQAIGKGSIEKKKKELNILKILYFISFINGWAI